MVCECYLCLWLCLVGVRFSFAVCIDFLICSLCGLGCCGVWVGGGLVVAYLMWFGLWFVALCLMLVIFGFAGLGGLLVLWFLGGFGVLCFEFD